MGRVLYVVSICSAETKLMLVKCEIETWADNLVSPCSICSRFHIIYLCASHEYESPCKHAPLLMFVVTDQLLFFVHLNLLSNSNL